MPVDSCVTRVPVFRTLNPEQQAEVAGFARPVHVAAGEQVMSAGSPMRRLLVVHSGVVRLVHLLDSGRERLIRMLGEGDAVGETSFVLGRRPDHFAFAETDAQLCTFHHEDLARLVARYPDIAVRMLQVQAERLAAAERMLAAFGNADVGARVAAYLLELPASPTAAGDLLELPMAKKDIASYLGTTPETLSRRLRELADAGAIELAGRRGVVIHDAEALIRRAEV
ncbi:Crp/Fnr family transcriptional regulator [Granulicoccus sp. GXG6511]|uniref:Crp/Fnr family transcriptional regulator n=1 Tax=Granulicoccus sp. GXG6511 TaxID=3381351 RepID=UPI003D7DBFB7